MDLKKQELKTIYNLIQKEKEEYYNTGKLCKDLEILEEKIRKEFIK